MAVREITLGKQAGFLCMVATLALFGLGALQGCGDGSDDDSPSAPTSAAFPTERQGDEINPALIVSYDGQAANVGSWKINSTITHVDNTHESITITRSTPTEPWPSDGKAKPSIGNWWMVGFVDGAWHAATVDFLGAGRTSIEFPDFSRSESGIAGPLSRWRPQPGEVFYVFQSSLFRASRNPNAEYRTNIRKLINK